MRLAALPVLPAEFVRVLGALAPGTGEVALIGAALAADATAGGHVCVDLDRAAGRPAFDGALDVPPLGVLIEALEASPIVTRAGGFAPLVLDGRRLYLHRYWQYETALASDLLARAASAPADVDEGRLAALLDVLFPPQGEGPDMQKVAAALAVLRRLTVISGGPGTGKTSTVAKIIAVLTALSAGRALAIGLAAPTGKAAARLEASLAAQPATRALGLRAVTLHRLLGFGGANAPRFNAENPLPLDVLVVDEASMVDLALAAKLVRALRPETRLILLGDRDQLASVEAGAVLGSIAGEAAGFSAPLAERLSSITGRAVPGSAFASPLSDAVVLLERSYRFDAASGIGRLARAVRAGDVTAAAAALDAGGGVGWQALDGETLANQIFSSYAEYFETISSGATPEQCFAALARFRVLAAVRGGPLGVEAVNRAVERRLAGRDPTALHRTWYPGRPVMVTANDYALRVSNGDVGIVLPDPDSAGGVSVAFETPEGGIRRLSPARMPDCETVYAMTVHKSQGSEFERVMLVLPDEPSPVLSRELVYTGVTRATCEVAVAASRAVFEQAVRTRLERDSGLAERLGARHA